MLKIRLARAGKKNQAQYKIVVAEHARPVKGKFIEVLGNYNPRSEKEKIKIDHERVEHWLKSGAQPSDTMLGIFKREGILPKNMEKRYEDMVKRSIAKAQNRKVKKEEGEEGEEGAKDSKATEDNKEDVPAKEKSEVKDNEKQGNTEAQKDTETPKEAEPKKDEKVDDKK